MSVIAFLPAVPLARPRSRPPRTRSTVPLALAPSPNPPRAPSRAPSTAPPPPAPRKAATVDPLPQPPPQSPLSYLWPRLLLLTVAIIWGTNFPVVKLLHTPPHPLPIPTAALARFSLAAVAMLPFIPVELRNAGRPSLPPSFLLSTLAIGVAVSAGYFSQSVALTTTDASTSAFICSLAVVVVPILNRLASVIGWVRDVERRPLLATWGAPLMAVVGVAMLEFGGTPPSVGDAWAFVQAIAFALGFVLNNRLAAKHPELVFSQSALQLNVVAALALLWSIMDTSATAGTFTFPHISDAFVNGTNALAVMYTGLITTALTVWLENVALKKVSAGELAVLLSTEPFWAASLAAILLGESMGPWAVAGGAVILLACVINQAGGTDIADILTTSNKRDKTRRNVKQEQEDLVVSFKKEKHR